MGHTITKRPLLSVFVVLLGAGTVIFALWQLVLADVYWRMQYHNARTEDEMVQACYRLVFHGKPRSIDCFVDALLRTSDRNQDAIRNQLIHFCQRHWGTNVNMDFDVHCTAGKVFVHVEATERSSDITSAAVKVRIGEKTVYDQRFTWMY